MCQGTVVVVFQPAEEGGGGAKRMVEAGVIKNVGAIFGLHVSTLIPVGSFGSRSGPILAACGFFEAVIGGKGGHAAIPQHTVDPILAASNVVVSLQHLVSREADPLDSQVFYLSHFALFHYFKSFRSFQTRKKNEKTFFFFVLSENYITGCYGREIPRRWRVQCHPRFRHDRRNFQGVFERELCSAPTANRGGNIISITTLPFICLFVM